MAVDFERRLLTRITEGSDQLAEVYESGLQPSSFEDPLARAAYSLCLEYWQDNGLRLSPTREILHTELPGLSLPPPEEVEEGTGWLVDFLQRRYAANQFQDILREAISLHREDPQQALRILHTRSYEATEEVTSRSTHTDMSLNVEERRRRYQERSRSEGLGGTGVTLGIDELDTHTSGLLPGELAVIGSRPKVGKSMTLCKAAHKARLEGYTPALFTLEMSRPEMEDRIDAIASGVSYDRLSKGLLSKEERRTLERSQEELRELGRIHILRPDQGYRTVSHVLARTRQLGADYLIIDQLSFMEARRRTDSLTEHHALVMQDLKTEIGHSSGPLPCLMAVQLNRKTKEQSDGPELENFANSTHIEATCDFALGLARSKDEANNHVMRMYLLAGRRVAPVSYLMNWRLVDRTEFSVLRKL